MPSLLLAKVIERAAILRDVGFRTQLRHDEGVEHTAEKVTVAQHGVSVTPMMPARTRDRWSPAWR